MSKDTIYREDAIKAFTVNNKGKRIPYVDCDNFPIEFPLEYIVKTIKELPSADRPQGEWIDADGNFVLLDKDGCTTASAWCSNCGEWLTGSDEYCTSGRFCPSCGARMKGADDE